MESQATSPAYPASLLQGLPRAQRDASKECQSQTGGASPTFVPDISPHLHEDALGGPKVLQPRPSAFSATLPIRAKQRPR